MTKHATTTPTTVHATHAVTRVIGDYDSGAQGPTLIVIGGLHGNEPAGIIAARRLLNRLERDTPGDFTGRFVALAGNITALNDENPALRYIDTDLNRMWTDERVRHARRTPDDDRTPEQRELVGLLGAIESVIDSGPRPVLVLDLHSVSSKSPPFVFVEDSVPARRLTMRFDIPIILGFEEELEGLLVDYCTNTLGLTSLLIEGGLHDHPETVDALGHTIRITLDAIGAWPIDSAADEPCPNAALDRLAQGHGRLVYDVRYRYPIRSESFRVDPRLHAFDPIRRDRTVIAHDDGRPVTAPIHGLLFMPNRQRRVRPGNDGFFIVRRIGRRWLRISAALRSMGVLHRMLPLLAPGVRRHPDHPHQLLIDPDLAAALKREVFHLLGYRILRKGENTSMSPRQRVFSAAMAMCRSVFGALINRIRGRHVPLVLRDDAWIVARRRLDIQATRRRP